jgi:proteasome lid subunit RPN8/RPN11
MLIMPSAELDKLRRHAEETFPAECCGILLGVRDGEERTVKEVVRCKNEAGAAQDRYRIHPRELIAAQKQARAAGLEIIGFYHSHPEHAARWSATDLAEAHWLECAYVITSVSGGIAGETKAFVLRGSGEEDKFFADEEISIF